MINITCLYDFYKRKFFRLGILFLLLLNASPLFSQEDVIDTIAVATDPASDSLSQLNFDDEYEDTAGKSGYNYYDYLMYWPSDSFVIRRVPDSIIAALKNQEAFWYADKNFKEKYDEAPKRNTWNWMISQKWFTTIAWLIITGGFATVLIWFLINSNVRLFTKSAKPIQRDDQLPENIFEINYTEEINKAMQGGNYRLAVRLQFLRLLKTLAEKNAIQYKEDATNFDYLLQLRNSAYYNGFFKVTRYYEYAWYGGFNVNEELYRTIKKDFESLDTQLTRH